MKAFQGTTAVVLCLTQAIILISNGWQLQKKLQVNFISVNI